MKAIVYDAIGAPAVLRDVPDPVCPDDGAVIAVRATGICRSDWHSWRGHDPVSVPHIPGHEFAGIVAAVGPQVRDFTVGERVTAPFVNGCGRCAWCRAGDAQICPDQTQPGFSDPGSYAEFVVGPRGRRQSGPAAGGVGLRQRRRPGLPVRHRVPRPDRVPDDRAG